jgi:hypothetical protein
MSYGEPTSAPDYGRFVDLANEVRRIVHNEIGGLFLCNIE